jgi:hypothetical protein
LFNPAFEAARFTTLDSFSRGEETFPDDQPPFVLSIATSADWATRLIFPVGQWIGMDRTELLKKTIGNYPSYRTHVLEQMSLNACGRTAWRRSPRYFDRAVYAFIASRVRNWLISPIIRLWLR